MTSGIKAQRNRYTQEVFAVVSGSFNKSLKQIQETMRTLSDLGVTILSPKIASPVSRLNGFVILEQDAGTPAQIERDHLLAILRSDFLYVVDPLGYIGESVALEIGYALSHKIPIYASERPKDEVFRSLLVAGLPLADIRRKVLKRKYAVQKSVLPPSPTLRDIQVYISRIVKSRGFSEESLSEVALLLVEEIGELTKEIRIATGLKVADDHADSVKSLCGELADCLFYLIDLANLADIDLENALREKEALDTQRKWNSRVSESSSVPPAMEIALLRLMSTRYLKTKNQLTKLLTPVETELLKNISEGYAISEIQHRYCLNRKKLERLMASIVEKLAR